MSVGSLRVEPAALSRLLDTSYAASLDRESWAEFTIDASRSLGCRLVLFQYQDMQEPQRSFQVSGGLGRDFDAELEASQVAGEDDLFWQAMNVEPAGTVRLGDEVIPPDARRRTRLFRRLAAPWHLEHHLMGVVSRSPWSRAFLSLVRTERDPPFLHEDKELLRTLLLAHLRRGLEFKRWLGDLEGVNSLFSALINQAPYGLVVTDGQARPLITNRKADEIVACGDGLRLDRGVLEATDPAAQARLLASLAAVTGAGQSTLSPPPVPSLVPRPSGSAPYYVVVTPLGMRSVLGPLPASAACAFVIHDGQPSVWTTLSPVFIAAYDLSRREVRLCDALLAGRTLPEAAEYLNISRNTAKTHLARIFDKTGVRSQNALLRLLAFGAHERGTRAMI